MDHQTNEERNDLRGSDIDVDNKKSLKAKKTRILGLKGRYEKVGLFLTCAQGREDMAMYLLANQLHRFKNQVETAHMRRWRPRWWGAGATRRASG